MFHRNKLSACALPWRTKNTIHKRTHVAGIIIHRILLSRNDLHDCEGVKHDLEKYFLVVKEYGQNTSLFF